MSINPYQPPQAVAIEARPAVNLREESDLSLSKATLYVLCMMGLAALLGSLVGMGIGTAAPEYYRHVFGAGSDTDFHPVAVGGVLGFLQGGGLGLAVGLVLVVIHYRYSLHLVRLRLKLK